LMRVLWSYDSMNHVWKLRLAHTPPLNFSMPQLFAIPKGRRGLCAGGGDGKTGAALQLCWFSDLICILFPWEMAPERLGGINKRDRGKFTRWLCYCSFDYVNVAICNVGTPWCALFLISTDSNLQQLLAAVQLYEHYHHEFTRICMFCSTEND
jgi:hypothetical protein